MGRKKTLCTFKNTVYFKIYTIYCKMITTILLTNNCITSHNYCFFSVVRRFKIYFLSNFQVYNTVLLTIFNMLYIRFSELIHLIAESLYSLTNISPFILPPTLPNYQFSLYFYEFSFCRFHI